MNNQAIYLSRAYSIDLPLVNLRSHCWDQALPATQGLIGRADHRVRVQLSCSSLCFAVDCVMDEHLFCLFSSFYFLFFPFCLAASLLLHAAAYTVLAPEAGPGYQSLPLSCALSLIFTVSFSLLFFF
jgi:hypothetical protein